MNNRNNRNNRYLCSWLCGNRPEVIPLLSPEDLNPEEKAQYDKYTAAITLLKSEMRQVNLVKLAPWFAFSFFYLLIAFPVAFNETNEDPTHDKSSGRTFYGAIGSAITLITLCICFCTCRIPPEGWMLSHFSLPQFIDEFREVLTLANDLNLPLASTSLKTAISTFETHQQQLLRPQEDPEEGARQLARPD